MKKLYRDRRGFTLLETIMVVAILGIILTVLYGFLNFNFKVLNNSNAEQDAHLQARIAMSKVINELKNYETLEYETSTNKIKGDGENINVGRLTGDLDDVEINFKNDENNEGTIIIKVKAAEGVELVTRFRKNH